jgi:hypothetical protein
MVVSKSAERLPVTLITGFLGSGKTTLLNRVLGDPRMARSLVLVNEFGEVGLDHLFMEQVGGDMVLRVAPDGTLNYRRGGTSINGVQVQNVTATGFEAGVFGLTTKFVVSAPAAVVDGQVQMTVDGVVLTKVNDG